jgi:hypothetical protein
MFKAFKSYIRSILFIAHLVGGLKILTCAAVSLIKIKLDGKVFLWGNFISSLGIFWEDKVRRE